MENVSEFDQDLKALRDTKHMFSIQKEATSNIDRFIEFHNQEGKNRVSKVPDTYRYIIGNDENKQRKSSTKKDKLFKDEVAPGVSPRQQQNPFQESD